jgi:hypothetical protein
MSEQYIYLGKLLNTYFFIHSICDSKFTQTISNILYDALAINQYIEDSNENVIIYELNDKTNQITITTIQHILKDEYSYFVLKNLSETFLKLIKAPRNDLFVVEYNYESKCYKIFELPKIPKEIEILLLNSPNIVSDFTNINEAFSNFIS